MLHGLGFKESGIAILAADELGAGTLEIVAKLQVIVKEALYEALIMGLIALDDFVEVEEINLAFQGCRDILWVLIGHYMLCPLNPHY